MTPVYNWKTNILEVNDKYDHHYYLQLRGNKNIIKGSSGTGKSYLYERLALIKKVAVMFQSIQLIILFC